MAEKIYKYVVVGGGIAGVTCAETLSMLCQDDEILLITASPLVKVITNYTQISKTLEDFDVEERPMTSVETTCPNVKVIQKVIVSLNSELCVVTTTDGDEIKYNKICICTGGKPKVISKDNPYVIGIRDTESVKEFQKRLCKARRIIVVGNGGIATELVYEIEGCEVIWAIKDKSITSTFVDPGAAEFFLDKLKEKKDSKTGAPSKRLKYTTDDVPEEQPGSTTMGGALGPDWVRDLSMVGSQQISHKVHVEYSVEVKQIYNTEEFLSSGKVQNVLEGGDGEYIEEKWPVYVEFTNNKVFGADFVVSATGVVPATDPFTKGNQFDIAEDGGFKVNDKMETTVKDVYAAGDVCSASWELAPHWIQMRLWSQARQMGSYAAKCMVASMNGENISMDFCFELFAHVTKFFNYKVILLGNFNVQKRDNDQDYELLLRVTKNVEYVKVVLKEGRLEGAILIGETDLEETFENLILNQTDLTPFKDHLLDPNIDIDDFFD